MKVCLLNVCVCGGLERGPLFRRVKASLMDEAVGKALTMQQMWRTRKKRSNK
jgi:hypothetical protein